MRRSMFASFLCFLVFTGNLFADLKITGPDQVDEHKIVELTAEGDLTNAAIIWDITPEEAADTYEIPNKNKILFTGPPGTYKVKCRSIKFKGEATTVEVAKKTVVIGAVTPPPPPLDDVFLKALQTAYASDTSPDKLTNKTKLAGVYTRALLYINNADLKTVTDVFVKLKTDADSTIPTDALGAIRRQISTELTNTLPVDPTLVLTSELRDKMAKKFKQIADTLDKVH